jgi:hypothetical protein
VELGRYTAQDHGVDVEIPERYNRSTGHDRSG